MNPLNKRMYNNQSIKIVPSVEDTLRGIGLNVDIDEATKLWLDQLKFKWKTWKKSTATQQHLDSFFQSASDPYRIALVSLVKCEEFKDCKPKSLPFYIIETLNKSVSASGLLPKDCLKLPAYHIATNQRNPHFLKLVLKTYHVSTIKNVIVPIIKNMIRSDNGRLALQVVVAMELFEDIPVEDLLFPCVLQDKTNLIDEYLSECPNQVSSFVTFLDNLIDKKFNTRGYVQNFIEHNNVFNVKYEKVHYKPLGKLVGRLCNKYNIPIESCKNLSKNRKMSGLRYLVYQKYVENNVSASVWEDLVKDSLQGSSECAHMFVDMLIDYDTKEALKWATIFQLPKNSLPFALKEMTLSDDKVKDEEECWDDNSSQHDEGNNAEGKFYRLPISVDKIVIIDTGEKMNDLVTDLIKYSVISIDCEWKPSFGATQSQVAIIQIATSDTVYLIDSLALNDKKYTSFWHRFHKSVLDNAEIIKLGFGLEQDLKEIKSSIFGLSNIRIKGEGLLDVSLLWKNLINCGLSLPTNSDSETNSLSSLVQCCFGLPLEKSEQCSNWELRPLRNTQIYYAALDAYILLETFYFLQKSSLEHQINFDEICNDVMLQRKLKSTKKTKVAESLLSSSLQSKNSVDVKILLESELSNLSSYLRYCGIDTTVTSQSILWHDAVNIALDECRYIVTAKLKISPTKKLSQNHILDVGKSSVKEQMQKILLHFCINYKWTDILSRCLKCNNTDLKNLTFAEVSDICEKLKSINSNNVSVCRYISDDDDDQDLYDRFLSDSDGDECVYQPVKREDEVTNATGTCVTSKGMPINICDVHKLSTSNKAATLCNDCGYVYWEEDVLIKDIRETIFLLTNITN